MGFLKAALMGMMQSLTEFLPVSSSGHRIIGEHFLGIREPASIFLQIMIDMGILLAVCCAFRFELQKMFCEVVCIGKDCIFNIKAFFYNKIHEREERSYRKLLHNNYRKLVMMFLISAITTGILQCFLYKTMNMFYHSLHSAGLGLMITAVFLLVMYYWKTGYKIPKEISLKEAFLVGIVQGVGFFPGISRTGLVITVALLCGWKKNFAVRYSFLLSIPTLIGALILELRNLSGVALTFSLGFSCVGGFITGVLFAWLGIRLMLKTTKKKYFKIFATYCFIAGLATLIFKF